MLGGEASGFYIYFNENKIQIYHCNEGKITKIPAVFTYFNLRMPGCLEKIIEKIGRTLNTS
jgi:hypothetical protein